MGIEGVIIEMKWQEALHAAYIGVYRSMFERFKKDNYHPGGEAYEPWNNDIDGALAEAAVAKYLGKYWLGAQGRKMPDLAECEVRATRWKTNRLILRKRDDPARVFVLAVMEEFPAVELAGWILGMEGMKEEYWGNPNNKGESAYWVPRDKLLSMEFLKEQLG
jgi:hypothetical protein